MSKFENAVCAAERFYTNALRCPRQMRFVNNAQSLQLLVDRAEI